MTENIKSIQQDGSYNTAIQNVVDSNINIQSFYKSLEYKELTERIEEMRDFMESTTDEIKRLKYSQKLNELQSQLEAFKRDIIQLAETFQKIDIDTERLRLAKQHFDNGEYKAARAVLDAEQMTSELDALLVEKERLNEKTTQNATHLKDKANEFFILAKLTAVDLSLGEKRYKLTKEYFEKSLKADRNINALYYYADFLRFHNEINDARKLYEETLEKCEFLGKEDPKYQKYAIDILNDIAGVYRLLDKTELAINSTEKVASYHRKNSKFSKKTADALNNLGILYEEKDELEKSEDSYLEAIEIVEYLASSDSKHLYSVAKTLNNLANLYRKKDEIKKEEDTCIKALNIFVDIGETQSEKHLSILADALDNMGVLSLRKKEYVDAENFLEKSLQLKKYLVSINPKAYIPSLIQTQANMSKFYYFAIPQKEKSISFAMDVLKIAPQFWDIPIVKDFTIHAASILKQWDVDVESLFDEGDESPE